MGTFGVFSAHSVIEMIQLQPFLIIFQIQPFLIKIQIPGTECLIGLPWVTYAVFGQARLNTQFDGLIKTPSGECIYNEVGRIVVPQRCPYSNLRNYKHSNKHGRRD